MSMETQEGSSHSRGGSAQLTPAASGQDLLLKEAEGTVARVQVPPSGPARVISIQLYREGQKRYFILPGGSTSAAVSPEQRRKADGLRISALGDLQEKKYRLAYRKIRLAAEMDPFSGQVAAHRRIMAARYRQRLDTYLYWLLVPWLPFLLYVRFLSSGVSPSGEELPGEGDILSLSIPFCMLAIGMALWIQRHKEKVH